MTALIASENITGSILAEQGRQMPGSSGLFDLARQSQKCEKRLA
jgi:hypothetical protein